MQLEGKLVARTAKVRGRIVHGVFTSLGASLQMKKGDWPKVTKKSSSMENEDLREQVLQTDLGPQPARTDALGPSHPSLEPMDSSARVLHPHPDARFYATHPS